MKTFCTIRNFTKELESNNWKLDDVCLSYFTTLEDIHNLAQILSDKRCKIRLLTFDMTDLTKELFASLHDISVLTLDIENSDVVDWVLECGIQRLNIRRFRCSNEVFNRFCQSAIFVKQLRLLVPKGCWGMLAELVRIGVLCELYLTNNSDEWQPLLDVLNDPSSNLTTLGANVVYTSDVISLFTALSNKGCKVTTLELVDDTLSQCSMFENMKSIVRLKLIGCYLPFDIWGVLLRTPTLKYLEINQPVFYDEDQFCSMLRNPECPLRAVTLIVRNSSERVLRTVDSFNNRNLALTLAQPRTIHRLAPETGLDKLPEELVNEIRKMLG